LVPLLVLLVKVPELLLVPESGLVPELLGVQPEPLDLQLAFLVREPMELQVGLEPGQRVLLVSWKQALELLFRGLVLRVLLFRGWFEQSLVVTDFPEFWVLHLHFVIQTVLITQFHQFFDQQLEPKISKAMFQMWEHRFRLDQ
jgi:hypothetical protein